MSGTNPAVEEAFDTGSKVNKTPTSSDTNPNVEEAFDKPSKPSAADGGPTTSGDSHADRAFDTGSSSKPSAPAGNSAVDDAFDKPSKGPAGGGSKTAADEAFDTPSKKDGLSAAQSEGQKSKFEKMVDPLKEKIGGGGGAGEGSGESGMSSKIKETLKGGHHAT